MPKIYSNEAREQLKEQLFEQGLTLLFRNGYKDTSVDEIVEQVGVSKGFFYSFFSSKQKFVLEVIERQQLKMLEKVINIMEKKEGSYEERIYDAIIACVWNDTDLLFLNTNVLKDMKEKLEPEVLATYQKECEKFYEDLVLAVGKDPKVCNPKIVGNLAIVIFEAAHSIPLSPYFYHDVLEDTIKPLVWALCHYVITH